MDKMDKLKGQGFFTKVKNTVEPTADKILGAVIPGYDYRSKKNRLNTDFSVRNKLSGNKKLFCIISFSILIFIRHRDGKYYDTNLFHCLTPYHYFYLT